MLQDERAVLLVYQGRCATRLLHYNIPIAEDNHSWLQVNYPCEVSRVECMWLENNQIMGYMLPKSTGCHGG